MDSHLEKWRRMRLGPRDSTLSASLLPTPTGTASQSANSTVLEPDGFVPLGHKNPSHGRNQMDSENGGKGNGSGGGSNGPDDNGSSNKNNMHGDKSPSDPSTSSGLPQDCSVNNIRPMVPFCQFLNDNDGSLQYSDGWSFSTSDPNGLVHTVHFTQSTGSSVSLMFNASNIIVFGLVPSGSSPPQASYSIDGSAPASPHLAATSQCVPNQQLFNSGNLATGLHNLTIDVTVASHDQPYIIDYLWVCGAGPGKNASENSTAQTETHGKTSKDGVIVGVVLGTIALVLAIAICVWMFVRRRRKRLARMRKLQLSPSPITSWLYWNSQSDERQSLFTSSEDILANNPTYSSSSGTRKAMNYRKAPPSFVISAPPNARMSDVSKATSLSRPASYEPPGLEDTSWYPRRMERAPSVVQE